VVDFYNRRIQDGPELDSRLRGPGGKPVRLSLSSSDQAALVAFLKTLTDGTVAGDPKFGDPFRP
jgi:cytochrome c peroxidase